MDGETIARVKATPAALELIKALQDEHGEILFHQSGGCCDGSAPMCYPTHDYMVGERDVRLGPIGGAQVYINREQFEYWKHTQLIIDVRARPRRQCSASTTAAASASSRVAGSSPTTRWRRWSRCEASAGLVGEVKAHRRTRRSRRAARVAAIWAMAGDRPCR